MLLHHASTVAVKPAASNLHFRSRYTGRDPVLYVVLISLVVPTCQGYPVHEAVK